MAGEGADWTALYSGVPQEVDHVWWSDLAREQVLLTLSRSAPLVFEAGEMRTATEVPGWLTGQGDKRHPRSSHLGGLAKPPAAVLLSMRP